MRPRRGGLIVAIAVISLALPTLAQADKQINVQYEWDATAGDDNQGCVTKMTIFDSTQKKMVVGKGKQNIKWAFVTTSTNATRGEWDLAMDSTKSDASLCEPKYKKNYNDSITCKVKADLKYVYTLTWSHSECKTVEADPEIVFKDGSGSGNFIPLLFTSGLTILFAFGTFHFWRRSKARS
jgi:hypothetical protein